MQYSKIKSATKVVKVRGPELEAEVLATMRLIADIVGGTLGPGGQPVLIERSEYGLPPYLTKDGVTVFRNLGMRSSVAHAVMEITRDAATRTASEAGDGTTTATVLAEAINRYTTEFVKKNPRISKQKVVRHLEKTYRDNIEPTIRSLSRKADLGTDEGREFLRSVARLSANGDEELADAVMECFELTGDEGNVTIVEASGPSRYEVESIDGYAIAIGYEESCGKFYQKFLNNKGSQSTRLENVGFILYHGRLTDPQTLMSVLETLGAAWGGGGNESFTKIHNYVLVATGFSDDVLASLALNFEHPSTLNVFPLLTPMSPQMNGQFEVLQDLAAITGAHVYDPINCPLGSLNMEDTVASVGPGVEAFECSRFRSNVIGHVNEDLLLERVDTVRRQVATAVSELDGLLFKERLAKLSGGIAKLKVIGSSNGELKEKRDRAEDAVCAVRGAIKHGFLPGGGWTLMKLCSTLPHDHIVDSILRPAFMEPVWRLLGNVGIHNEEMDQVLNPVLESLSAGKTLVYDAQEQRHVDAYEAGILDSTPAVTEAVRNALSIASNVGTMGGLIVFERDEDLERAEARANIKFMEDMQAGEIG